MKSSCFNAPSVKLEHVCVRLTSSTFCALRRLDERRGSADAVIGRRDNRGRVVGRASRAVIGAGSVVGSGPPVRRRLPGCARRHFGVTVKR